MSSGSQAGACTAWMAAKPCFWQMHWCGWGLAVRIKSWPCLVEQPGAKHLSQCEFVHDMKSCWPRHMLFSMLLLTDVHGCCSCCKSPRSALCDLRPRSPGPLVSVRTHRLQSTALSSLPQPAASGDTPTQPIQRRAWQQLSIPGSPVSGGSAWA